ncbi:hypothetical protein [Sphaerisporangium fuscum]|uniref:hypothetical protein n=1 Tax=Sphaerisporangium fuscum TaxID=2835868 RepID=UPI001BDBCC05|nr:hypothetical protein [Sphaerisporangium fuscum]
MPLPGELLCARCGTVLHRPARGRSPRFCSTVCRQAAYRDRRRARHNAGQAGQVLADIREAAADTIEDAGYLAELMEQATPSPEWRAELVDLTRALAERADQLARAAHRYTELADDADITVYDDAVLEEPPSRRLTVQEAAVNFLAVADPSLAVAGPLPVCLAVAIAEALDGLHAATRPGRSTAELAVAARAVLAAAEPHRSRWPATFAQAHAVLAKALAADS